MISRLCRTSNGVEGEWCRGASEVEWCRGAHINPAAAVRSVEFVEDQNVAAEEAECAKVKEVARDVGECGWRCCCGFGAGGRLKIHEVNIGL